MALKFSASGRKSPSIPPLPIEGRGDGGEGSKTLPAPSSTLEGRCESSILLHCPCCAWQGRFTPRPRPLSPVRGEGSQILFLPESQRHWGRWRGVLPASCRHAAGIAGNRLQRSPAFGGSAGASIWDGEPVLRTPDFVLWVRSVVTRRAGDVNPPVTVRTTSKCIKTSKCMASVAKIPEILSLSTSFGATPGTVPAGTAAGVHQRPLAGR